MNREFVVHVTHQTAGHALHGVILLSPTIVLGGGLDAMIIVFVLTIVLAGVLESAEVVPPSEIAELKVQDRLALRVAMVTGLILLALLWLAQLERIGRSESSWTIHLCGGALVATGIALRVLAIKTLKQRFHSDIAVHGDVIRSGIYAWMRHPSEIGLICLAIGGPLLVGAPIAASIAAMSIVPISLWRMRRENEVLNKNHAACA